MALPDVDTSALPTKDPPQEAQAARDAAATRTVKGVTSRPEPPVPEIKGDDDPVFQSLEPGSRYRGPDSKVYEKPWVVEDDDDFVKVPEGKTYVAPDGNSYIKPKYEPLSFTAQMLFEMAQDEGTKENALRQMYGNKVKKVGSQFVVDDDGTLRAPGSRNLPTGAATATANTAPTAGMVGGGLLGAGAGTAVEPGGGTAGGALAGETLGGMGGRAFNNSILALYGVHQPMSQNIASVGNEGLGVAAGGAIGRGIAAIPGKIRDVGDSISDATRRGLSKSRELVPNLGPILEGLGISPGLMRDLGNVTPENAEIARAINEKGGKVPGSRVAPGLAIIKKVEQFNEAFGDSTLEADARRYADEQISKMLTDEHLGIKVSEPPTRATSRPSSRQAGEMAIAAAQRDLAWADGQIQNIVRDMQSTAQAPVLAAGGEKAVMERRTRTIETLNAAQEASRKAGEKLVYGMAYGLQDDAEDIGRLIGSNEDASALNRLTASKFRAFNQGTRRHASQLYDNWREAVKDASPPDVSGLAAEAEAFLRSVPAEVRGKYPDDIGRLQNLVNPERGQPVTWADLHQLRSWFRHGIDYMDQTPDMRTGALKKFERQINNVLHDPAYPEQYRQLLDIADQNYATTVPFLGDQMATTVIKSLESGAGVDADVVANVFFDPDRTTALKKVRGIMGENAWRAVEASHTRKLLENSKTITGDIDFEAFHRQVEEEVRSGIIPNAYTAETADRIRKLAVAAGKFRGALDLKVAPNDTLTEVLRKGAAAKQRADKLAQTDPLAALKEETARIAEYRTAAEKALKEAVDEDPLNFLFKPAMSDMAVTAADNILKNPDLMRIFRSRFGRDSEEFKALQKVWVQRFLQRPFEKLGGMRKELAEKVTEEQQAEMFPGVTKNMMLQFSKEMDFLLSDMGADVGGSLAGASRVLNPGRYLGPLGAATKMLTTWPGVSTAHRILLGKAYSLVVDATSHPNFGLWLTGELASNDVARRNLAKKVVQQRLNAGGLVGAAAGQRELGGNNATPPDDFMPPSAAPEKRSALDPGMQFAMNDSASMSDADPPRVGGQTAAPQDDLVPPVSYGEHKQYRSADPVMSQLGIPQASDAEMAQEARDAATQRQVRTNTPKFGGDRPDISDLLGRLIIPGYALGEDLYQGEYGDAAIDAVFAAAPYARGIANAIPAPVKSAATKALASAAGLGGFFGATSEPSTAKDDADFSFIDNPDERKIAQSKWEHIKVYKDGKYDNIATRVDRQKYAGDVADEYRKAAQKKLEKEAEAERTAKAAGKEREAAETTYREFEDANRETIGKFTDEQKAQWNALAGADAKQTRKNRQEFLVNESNKAAAQAEERKLAERAFAQKYPTAANALRVAGVVLGIGMPLGTSVTRAGALKTHAKAIDKAITDVTKTAQAEGRALTVPERQSIEPLLALKAGKIEEAAKLHSFAKRDLILAPMMPIAANDWLPNMFDAATLGDNPDNPNYKKALAAIDPRDPAAFVDAAVPYLPEAIIDVGLGLGGGHTIRDFSGAKASAKGSLRGAEGFIKDTRALEQTEKTAATSELMKRAQEAESKLKEIADKRTATNAKTAETRRQKVEAAKKAEEDAKKPRPVGRTKQQLKGQNSP